MMILVILTCLAIFILLASFILKLTELLIDDIAAREYGCAGIDIVYILCLCVMFVILIAFAVSQFFR